MIEHTRTENTVRNMIYGFINKGVTLIMPFVTRTSIIYQLGADYTGVDSLFTSILQMLNVAELGFSSAIMFSLYKPIAENNKKEICEWLALYRRIYHIVGAVILCFGLGIFPCLKFMIKGNYPEDINIYILYFLYLLNSVIRYFTFSYKEVLLIGYQRRDIISNIELIVIFLRNTFQMITLIAFKNFYVYTIWTLISTLASNIAVEAITRKKYPELMCENRINIDKVKNISNHVKGIAIGKVSLMVRNSFGNIILSAKCGLIFVTIYSNYYFVFSAISQILFVIITSMAASVGNSLVTESVAKNYEDHNKFDFIYMWIVGWCTVCLFCLYQPFMALWVGDKLMAPFSSMVLFCLYFYVNQLAQIRSVYSEAAGLWWRFRYLLLVDMGANIGLNVILGSYYGMNGILITSIITAFLSSFIATSAITFKFYFCESIRGYFMNNAMYFVITLFVLLITSVIISFVEYDGFYGLVLKGIICIIIPNILYVILYFFPPKYREIMIWERMQINSMLKKKRI